MSDADPKLRELLEFLADNLQMESRLLYPNPQGYVFITPLLDLLSKQHGQGVVATVFNERMQAIEDGGK